MNYYIDQDGVLAIYEPAAYQGDNPIWLKPGQHYFKTLKPDYKMLNVLYTLSHEHTTTSTHKTVSTHTELPLYVENLYVLSSLSKNGNTFLEQVNDKKEWLNEYCPSLDINKSFKPAITSKPIMAQTLKGEALTLHDILIDDHNPNLRAWAKAGGLAVKYVNGINSADSFDGLHLEKNMTDQEIIIFLSHIANAIHNI